MQSADDSSHSLHTRHTILVVLVLCLFFGLALFSSLDKSLTFDEGFYIARGWAMWRTGRVLPLGHPPLSNLISGLGPLLEPGLPHPSSLAGWTEGNPELFSEDLLWGQGLNATRIIFLSRVPTIWLGLILGAVIWRWGRELYGKWSGTLALTLYALSPNILAHAHLATTDMIVAVFYVITLYAWYRLIKTHRLKWLITTGVFLGLAQASKFSALLLLPTLGLMALWIVFMCEPLTIKDQSAFGRISGKVLNIPGGRLWTTLLSGLIICLVGLLALWITTGFRLSLSGEGTYLSEFAHFRELAGEGHNAYLLGRFSEQGWWYYHLVVLGVKLPETTLILLLTATVFGIGRGVKGDEWLLLFPALIYLGASLLISLNVGVRYLLPIFPMGFLFISRLASGHVRSGWLRPASLGVMVALNMVITFIAFPHYIPYFNMVSGGSDNGLRILADSNMDWGQDLPALADYINRRGGGPVYLSYFGQADPHYYGIQPLTLPAWPPLHPDPEHPFYPVNPEPGLYAISASNLIGVALRDPNSFGYFLNQEPIEKIGHSIYIYEVSERTMPESPWVGQCIDNPLETEESAGTLIGFESYRSVYFNCESSLLALEEPGWILLPVDVTPVANIGEPIFTARNANGTPYYHAYLVDGFNAIPTTPIDFPQVDLPLPIANHLSLLGYALDRHTVMPGETITLTAWWQVREPPPPPVSIFAHVLNPDGTLVSAGDALGVAVEEWGPGMMFVQQHQIQIPESTPAGDYTVTIGLYSLDTGERFPVSQSGDRIIDRVVLRTIQVTGEER